MVMETAVGAPARCLARGAVSLVLVVAGAAARRRPRRGGSRWNRFSPSGGGSDWFALESLDFRGHFRPSGGVTFNYADQPLAVHDSAGNTYGNAIVDTQLFVHGGLAMMWRDRVRFGLDFPLAIHQAGNQQTVGDFTFRSANRVAAGDLRVGGDVLLTGESPQPLAGGGGARAAVPHRDPQPVH